MQPIETIEYKGFEINIYQDELPPNPRSEDIMLPLVKIYTWTRDDIGDSNPYETPRDFLNDMATDYPQGEGVDYFMFSLSVWGASGETYINIKPYPPENMGPPINGYAFITAKDAADNYIFNPYERIRDEIELYSQYLNGDVYGYSVEGGGHDDSCWGFFGDPAQAIYEAKINIDWFLKQEAEADLFVNNCFAL